LKSADEHILIFHFFWGFTLRFPLNRAGNREWKGKDGERKKGKGVKRRDTEVAREICATAARR
jgi:hypothetical protein